jgi:tetratricopeptide (TPR) repeat protein
MTETGSIEMQNLIKSGNALQARGKFADAERIYLQALQRQPADFYALYFLGVVCLQMGQAQRGANLIAQAITIDAKFAPAHNNLGSALRDLNRPAEALASYDRAIALKLDYAVAHHNRGLAIALKPDFAEAHFDLGNILRELKRLNDAFDSYNTAIRLVPDYAQAHHNLALVESDMGQQGAALASLDQAISFKPDFAAAYGNRGLVLMGMGRMAEAMASLEKAIVLEPGYAVAYNNRGLALAQLERPTDALASYDIAIALKPDFPIAHSNRGRLLMSLGRPVEALESFDKTITLQPDFAEAHYNHGLVFKALGRADRALQSFSQAIVLDPGFADAYCNRGSVLRDMMLFEDALESLDRAIALQPDYAEAFCNRGLVSMDLRRLEEALANYDTAIRLKPDFAEAYSNRGLTLTDMKQFDAALESYDKAIALKPDFADSYWNKSYILLLTGQFEQGWHFYEWRKKLSRSVPGCTHTQPLWLGEGDLAGNTLLIESEQGYGDVIQFSRYAQLAAARGAKVVLSVPDKLVRLMKSLTPAVDITDSRSAAADFDFHIPLLSMPMALKTDQDSIPAAPIYLRAEPNRVAKWNARIGNDGYKIGICWQGSKLGAVIGKPFSLRQFSDVAKIPNVRLISLQKGDGVEQLQDLPPDLRVESLGEDFDSGPDAFVDAAAVMECLDLIITTDTSIAHLGGALGRPTWVLLKYMPDWRWFLDRSDSPWYPTMRLFRQAAYDSWSGVFAEIKAQLSDVIGEGRPGRETR